ncbi:hypothetical protein J437_LFUL004190 [Ladona fulva]|uniref:Large ribosomal subunit protein bL28m n=1 Tax=Ladona fulva TaxID=123851 RepID=A0A8K0NZI3_LADFU|nr:hypothetical protein J437_LFUL004190 [Ladona fulva]
MESKAIQVLAWSATKNIVEYSKELPKRLPQAYKKFWYEWKEKDPKPVHWIPEEGKWKRDPETGIVRMVKNHPIPVLYPKEHDHGLWGGEGLVKGFQKRHPMRRRVPHYWMPSLKKSVVYSEILNKHINVVVTDTTLNLIHEHHGLDFYLLKTPACDLKSNLALKLKRKLLLALLKKDFYHENEKKKNEVFQKYCAYMLPEEEAEWYGLTYKEALAKLIKQEIEANKPQPYKYKYKMDLMKEIKESGITAVTEEEKSWVSKINPFKSQAESTH